MPPSLRKCGNTECSNTFQQFNSLNKFCSFACKKKCGKAKPPNKMSAKRKVESKLYSELRAEFLKLPQNQICPITGHPTTDVHHTYSGKDRAKHFLDVDTWIAVSRDGHNWIHDNPLQSRELGYLK